MQIINYFESDRKEHWKKEIALADWGAAGFLVELLENKAKFDELLGEETRVYLMVDGDKLVSFQTLAFQDGVRDESLFPWIGFVFTFPEYRGNRYSEQLIRHAEAQAKNEGRSRVYIATDYVGLYEKFGYEYMESRIDFFGDEMRVYYHNI